MVDIPGDVDDCVLMYGHLDKQPEFTGWADGLDPWTPVVRDGKLYGRGGADDGYALFSSIAAVRALREQGVPHARCVVLIEASEESGSPDLPAHIDALGARLGTPSLVVCLDAECGNYDQLWCTTSLRGNLVGTLRADVLTEGVHSGMASGIVPSSFRVLRELLARVEDVNSGAILVDELNTPIPPDRLAQAASAAPDAGADRGRPHTVRAGHAARVERPARTGAQQHVAAHTERDGRRGHPALPQRWQRPATLDESQAVLPARRPRWTRRWPPQRSSARSNTIRLTARKVSFDVESAMGGWNAPAFAPWLEESMQRASQAFFGKRAMYMGTGGSIPFMGMLGEKFPGTQFLITGVLGPNSNAHGPNEFLHIETARKVTGCVSQVLADHAAWQGVRKAA